MHWKGRNDSFKVHRWVPSHPLCFLTLTNTKQLSLEKGCFLSTKRGWTLCLGEAESKFHIGPHCRRRINRSIYLACSLSTCFLVWEDPMEESHWVEKWKRRGFFSPSIPIFFCYNDAPGAVGIPGPNRGEQRHRKQRPLQLHACGPLRLPRGETKTNINVGSLLQE